MTNVETCSLYPNVYLYKPQLVAKSPYTDISVLSYKDGWFASEKIDGYWECLVKENNEVYMFARSKSKTQRWYTQKIGHVPFLKDWALEELPNGTMLIGEIFVPNGTSKDVTSILGCKEEKAIQRQQENGNLHFYIHDILKYNNEDYVQLEYSNDKRNSLLYEQIDLNTNLIPEIKIAEYLDSVYIDFDQSLENIFKHNGEGLVFKKKNGLYLPGKRHSQEMFKVKQHEDSLDFVISGFVAPEKEYTGKEIETWPYWEDDIPVTKAYYNGWKMGFVLSLFDDNNHLQEIGKVTSGLTDEMRADIAQNPNKYFARVAEISCMSVDKDKLSIRHPALIRVRDDKDAHDCKIKDVFK